MTTQPHTQTQSHKIKIKKNYFISGVGTIIIQNYKNTPCIIMAREKNKSEYLKKDQWEEFGGAITNNIESIPKNAIYELTEETANMIKINEDVYERPITKKTTKTTKKELKRYIDTKVPVKTHNDYFRCYFLRMDDFRFEPFYKNRRVLKENKDTPECYLEIDELTRIPLSHFENSKNFVLEKDIGYYGNFETFLITKDIDERDIRISQRTMKILLDNHKNKINGLKICKILCSDKSEDIKLKKIGSKVYKNAFEKRTVSFVEK